MHTTDSREDRKMIKAAVFDIDNTMYSFDKANLEASRKLAQYCESAFSLSREEFQDLHVQAKKNLEARLGLGSAAIHNRLIRFQHMLEMLHCKEFNRAVEMYHIYWDTVLDAMEPEPGLLAFLRVLHGKGIRIGVGSDMTSYIQYRKLKRMEVLQYIDGIVTSEEAGAEKPDPRFFRLCAEKLCCAPEECVFIGDHVEKDVEGSSACGMHGVWYCPNADEEGARPRIRSYEDCVREGGVALPCGKDGQWESIG